MWSRFKGKFFYQKTSYRIPVYCLHINEMDSNIEIRSLDLISHPDARSQTFKLEVSITDFFKVKDRNFWESGIICHPFRGEWHRDPSEDADGDDD